MPVHVVMQKAGGAQAAVNLGQRDTPLALLAEAPPVPGGRGRRTARRTARSQRG